MSEYRVEIKLVYRVFAPTKQAAEEKVRSRSYAPEDNPPGTLENYSVRAKEYGT